MGGRQSDTSKCYFIDKASEVETAMSRILQLLADIGNMEANISGKFISMGCQGSPTSLQLIQIVTDQEVYMIDCQTIGGEQVCELLKILPTNEYIIKLVHDASATGVQKISYSVLVQ